MEAQTLLVAAGAFVILALGLAHLLFTFSGPKLMPRELGLMESMKTVAPVITTETSMWRAWIGFNASHSLGAILFGLVFGYLALLEPDFLFRSPFLEAVGFLTLAAYFALGRKYWFRVPFAGISIALMCYATGILVAHV